MTPIQTTPPETHIAVTDLTMAYGDFLIQKDLNFTVNRGDVFIIMGGSGCGKSTLLKVMIGLKKATKGDVTYDGKEFWASLESEREARTLQSKDPFLTRYFCPRVCQ